MILFFVLVGFLAGAVSAGYTLATGGGVLAALLAYSVFGAVAVVVCATIVAIGPTLLRQRPSGAMSVEGHMQRR